MDVAQPDAATVYGVAEWHWRDAAELAMTEFEPLFVLKVAEDWGAGETEAKRLLEEACKIMGRPTDQVVRELRDARRVI